MLVSIKKIFRLFLIFYCLTKAVRIAGRILIFIVIHISDVLLIVSAVIKGKANYWCFLDNDDDCCELFWFLYIKTIFRDFNYEPSIYKQVVLEQ